MHIRSSQISGLGVGKKELVPTINLKVPSRMLLPHGIYVAYVTLRTRSGPKKHRAVVHFGPRPVLNDESLSLEIHIIDSDLCSDYDMDHVEVETISKLRDIKPYKTMHDLKKQITKDIRLAHSIFDTLR